MNQLEGFLILVALPLSLLLTGYWLAALLIRADPLERLAFSLPSGLALLLAAAAAMNFFQPLRGGWAYACLTPTLFTLLLPRARASLVRDLAGTVRTAPRLVLGAGAVFFLLLLWPVLQTPSALFYDGTSNHDSFFWISGAEHLKRHTYMELPVVSTTQPLTNSASALIGWNPPWGRIGGEALLALASSVINVSPLKLYLYATASLALTWFALVYLALRTFVTDFPSRLTGAAVVCLQPIFVFFYGNANLPNLLGTLTGTALIVAVERAIRAGTAERNEFTAWAALAALSLHGLLCSYPEMVPFALLPCGLLWLRPWFGQRRTGYWHTALIVIIVLLAGAAMNPATTIRGVRGFFTSYAMGRADTNWANLFAPLDLAEYIPGLVTLSISACKELEWWFGWPLSALIVGLLGLVQRRSRDPFGLCAALSGSAVLFAYTIVMGFSYGWQKTVQFSGIFFAVLFPAAAIEVLWRLRESAASFRRVATAALAALAVFLAFAGFMNCRDIYKWSDRKVISADWFKLRDHARTNLANAPVLVEAASFRMAFFHGMWAAYFLPESRLYYGARGEESGGYLRYWVVNEQTATIPAPAAVLVGRPWSDSFDANSPRILTGREYCLLQKNNRVFAMAGANPLNGVPDTIDDQYTLEILPHSPSNLRIELAPRLKQSPLPATWQLARQAAGTDDFNSTVSGPPPWRLSIPLVAGQRNRVSISLAAYAGAREELQISVRSLRIEDSP
ncbi:MAG TPA: hypothetical protein VIM71_10875 [Lacunisphaera sp.]